MLLFFFNILSYFVMTSIYMFVLNWCEKDTIFLSKSVKPNKALRVQADLKDKFSSDYKIAFHLVDTNASFYTRYRGASTSNVENTWHVNDFFDVDGNLSRSAVATNVDEALQKIQI